MAYLLTSAWRRTWNYLEPWVADRDMPDQFGKVAIVTGATSGIGLEVARQLAAHQAQVVIGARNPQKAQWAVASIKEQYPWAKVDWIPLDLASFESILSFADAFKAKHLPLHILVNNAGLGFPEPHVTADGFEWTLQSDYYGHALLTLLLLDKLKASAPSRVVNMASQGYMTGSICWEDLRGQYFPPDNSGRGVYAYGMAKLMLILWSQELQQRLKGTGVDVFAVHPGLVASEFPEKLHFQGYGLSPYMLVMQVRLFGQTVYYGAQSTLYAATEPKLRGRGGQFLGPNQLLLNCFNTSHNWLLHPTAWNPDNRRHLYTATLQLLDESTAQFKPGLLHGVPPLMLDSNGGMGSGAGGPGSRAAAAGSISAGAYNPTVA